MKAVVLAIFLLLGHAVVTTDATPTLTDAQKLAYQAQVSRALSAQVQALLAQRELESAQREMASLLAGWAKPGYALDTQTLTYVKAAPKTETPK